MSIESLLRDRATIERATSSVNSSGDVTPNWATVASAVPCRIEELRVHSSAEDFGALTEGFARGFFPPDTDLRPTFGQNDGDRITVDSIRYLVVGVVDAPGKRGRLQIARLQRTE